MFQGVPDSHACGVTGFGLPNRRKRVFVLASLHGDARDVLLSQVICTLLISKFKTVLVQCTPM